MYGVPLCNLGYMEVWGDLLKNATQQPKVLSTVLCTPKDD